MPPIIGITTSKEKNSDAEPINTLTQAYVNAIMEAGGVPILIPSSLLDHGWESLLPHLDGILFSGGGDIGVEHFAGEAHPRIANMDPARDSLELRLLDAAADTGKPFLGICRGCQLVNVGFGGTLYTHIADQVPGALDHDYPGTLRTVLVHRVKIDASSRLGGILGANAVDVNSHHHQGLKEIAPGLRVAGRAPDGLVEAVELPDHPFGVAVQWHPEWLTDQSSSRNLFRRFVAAAGNS